MRLWFGTSMLSFEPPDTVVLEPRGTLDGEAANAMLDQVVEWSRGRPFVLVLIDLRSITSFSPAARRALASNGHRLPPRALALHGGSFGVRVTMDLMERASTILGSKDRWARHWPDEAAARAWLAEMRERLSARPPSPR